MKSKKGKQIESGTTCVPLCDKIRKGGTIVNCVTSEIGVAGNIVDDCVAVTVRCTGDGELCEEEVVMYLKDCRPATLKEKKMLQRLLPAEKE